MESKFRFKSKKIYLSGLFFICIQLLNGKEIQLEIENIKKKYYKSEYNFLVGGHLYGDPRKATSPSNSLLNNIHKFNQLSPLFFISLGDNYRAGSDSLINNFINSFPDKLNFPFLTVMGNHDATDRAKFKEYFGKTYYDFSIGSEHFIILDSEFNDLKNQKQQIKYFDELITKISKDNAISNVFILTHKLLWADLFNKYSIVFQNSNNTSSYSSQREFGKNIFRSLNLIKNTKNIFWLSGDVGIWRSYPIFYEKDRQKNITFIATGLGDTEDDMVLNIFVQKGQVTIKGLLLNNSKYLSIKKYDLIFWENLFSNKFKTQNILTTFKAYLLKSFSKETLKSIIFILLFIPVLFLFFFRK
tara:strand:- start:605 stop:1678 length:1074 start_codon:yes stop_codon:yes gene_type:complete